jgi:ABC-2 type transport system permease protein
MSDILIIARREFLAYVRTRGFLLTLFFIPAWLVLGGLLQQVATETKQIRHFAVVDETGLFIPAIDRALAQEAERSDFRALAAYVAANTDSTKLKGQTPDAAGLLRADANDPSTLTRFDAAGGSNGVLARLQPLLDGQSDFVAPDADLQRIDLPPALDAAVRNGNRAALGPALKGDLPIATAKGPVNLFAIAVIPPGFSIDAPAIEYWGENQTDPAVQNFLRRALQDELRLQTAAQLRLDPPAVHRLLDTSVLLVRFNPANADAKGAALTKGDILRVFLPFAVVLLLLVAILSISSMLLMAVIEEKSNRVIELILASTSAYRLMAGKLLGAAGAAVILMAGWVFGAGGALSLLTHSPMSEVATALVQAHALDDLPAMILCVICGLAIHTTIFLGVGAMARSFQEAQSYLGPLLFVLFAPLGFVTFVYNDPNGFLATALSFSPLHAPFFLMMRLPDNPPPVSTAIAFVWMVICTIAILRLMVLGFTRFILPGERAPLIPALWRRFRPGSRQA